MEYLWATVLLISTLTLTTILSGFLGLLLPITYTLLGFILGFESTIIGSGLLLGSIINYINVGRYIKKHGAMSYAPRYSKIASIGFIIIFTLTTSIKYTFNLHSISVNFWHLIVLGFLTWLFLSIVLNNKRRNNYNLLNDSIESYRILEKYDESPKWAIYLYLRNGQEIWNKTIPGSFAAKNPDSDLTFVFSTKEQALSYAKHAFTNAKYIED